MNNIKVAIIGGSGLAGKEFFTNLGEIKIETPFGEHSDGLVQGKIHGLECVLLLRHGKRHQFSPTQVNFRANLWALKELGCTHIIATTAVGSLREHIKAGDFVVIDQFIDFTKQRKMTFHENFENGSVHTAMAKPFDDFLRNHFILALEKRNYPHHREGTVVTIEGPRFSTKAESKMFRILGADIINMSIATEATLANELSIPYSAIAMVTDYDSWHEEEEAVTWEAILKVFNENSEKVTYILEDVVKGL